MPSSQSAEYEAERLDRLEREVRRRQWDSVLVRPRDPNTPQPAPSPGLRRDPVAETPTPSKPDPYAVLELMVERLDRLERLSARLESEVRVMDRYGRKFRWRLIAVLVATSAAGMALMPWWVSLWRFSESLMGR